jgi:hypothetical protein
VYDKNGKNIAVVEHGGFYVPRQWVCLESLSLNHTRDAICSDAITIRYRLNEKLRIPEWKKGRRSFPAAYVKDSRIAVRPGFSASDDIYNATLKAYAVSGSLGDIKAAQTFFNPQSLPPIDSTPCTISYFQVATNTPGKVNSFYQQWEWYLMGVNDGPNNREVHIGTTINKIYIVLDVPQSPWTVEGDTAPWSDVLDLCCQVAHNESESESAAQKITQFLYQEVGGLYQETARYSKPDNACSDFQLKRFHNSIPNVDGVNCYDMGKALVTYGNVLGCNLTLRYCRSFGELYCIKPVGSHHWMCDMCFNNHAFASIGDNIFDASLKADSRGNPGLPPYRSAWMVDVPWCDYKEMVVKKATDPLLYPQISIFKIDSNQD